jgi:threonine/homoserine/homoserine lactone efflux protein
MWLYILQGIGYGFAAAAQPGPFQTYLISQTLLNGWKRTLPAAFAPLLSDGPIIVLSLLLLSQVPPGFQRFFYVAGGLFILYLAYGNYKSWKDFDPDRPFVETEVQQRVLRAALINALNPNPYIFWSLVTGPILMKGWREVPLYGVGFLTGFYLTMIVGFVTLILIFGLARQLGTRVNHLLLGISAVALFCFGLYQLWMGIINASAQSKWTIFLTFP